MHKYLLSFWAVVLAVVLTACLLTASPPVYARTRGSDNQPPVILAAASLQEALSAAADAWQAKGHPRPRISFAASSALARQIQSGAPADIFISADEAWMDALQSKGLLRPASRASLLTNSLVLIAPRNSTITLRIARNMPILRAMGAGRLAIADPAGVPAGIYAKQALTHLGVWQSLQGRLAPGENVRSALALVSRGITPLGIVYATDARADAQVRIVGAFPANSHDAIHYPIAILSSSRNRGAVSFRNYLLSPEGKSVFRRFGFGTR